MIPQIAVVLLLVAHLKFRVRVIALVVTERTLE